MHPAALEIADQGGQTAAVRLVGDEQAAVLHGSCDLCGFAPGGGGEIQDALTRLRVEDGNGEGRRLGLYVTAPEEVFEGCAETVLAAVELKDVGRPGNSAAAGGAGPAQQRGLRH